MRAAALLRPGAWLLLAVVLAGALAGCGVTAPRGSDGYADLDSLGVADTDRVLTLSIGPALLRFAAAHVEDDPETRELLRSLDGVRIRVYEINGDAARVAQRMGGISLKLQTQGWERVLLARSEGEEAHMLMKVVDQRICGMTVLVSDGESEAVVVNLMGDIQPRQFSNVMTALDVDAGGAREVRPDEVRPDEGASSPNELGS
ncbi:MAG: DUF4252 domain-containing protein [Lysobacterales bacterium]